MLGIGGHRASATINKLHGRKHEQAPLDFPLSLARKCTHSLSSKHLSSHSLDKRSGMARASHSVLWGKERCLLDRPTAKFLSKGQLNRHTRYRPATHETLLIPVCTFVIVLWALPLPDCVDTQAKCLGTSTEPWHFDWIGTPR